MRISGDITRKLAAMLALSAMLLVAATSHAEDMTISARGAVVMDSDTGAVIISKNKDRRMPPASTTKVMTAILALEKLNMGSSLRVSAYAAARQPTKINLRQGDVVTVEALMYSMLLKSANDAATVIAEGIAGSESAFARMMTEKAASIGAKNTEFKTCCGLPAKGQYSTAYDLALILRYALKQPGFIDIASTRYATLNMGKYETKELKNSNKLLWIYEGAVAGKTGYTRSARTCYVGEADCSGRKLIVSLLGSNDRWDDAVKLLDKGFELAEKGETLELKGADPPAVTKKSRSSAHRKTSKKRHR